MLSGYASFACCSHHDACLSRPCFQMSVFCTVGVGMSSYTLPQTQTASIPSPQSRPSQEGRNGSRHGNRPAFSSSVSAGLVLLELNSVNLFCAHRDMDLEGLNAHTKVQTVWHNNAQHRLVTSTYNPGVRSALVVPLRPPKVLGAGAAGGGGEERAELEAQIQASEQVRTSSRSPHSACCGSCRCKGSCWLRTSRFSG